MSGCMQVWSLTGLNISLMSHETWSSPLLLVSIKILQNLCVWKKMHKTSKNHQIPSRFGYVGQYVTYNKCWNFFLKKMLQRLRLPKGIPKNWHIFMLSTVGTLIFQILPPETSPLTYLKNCQKYAKLYIWVTSSKNIYL